MLIQRGDAWLLVVRAPTVGYAPNKIGMIGGHVEVINPVADILEMTARREVAEEVGLDLSAARLTYLGVGVLRDRRRRAADYGDVHGVGAAGSRAIRER